MYVKTDEFVNVANGKLVIYYENENKDYTIGIRYHRDENGNPITDVDPRDPHQFEIKPSPNKPDGLDVIFHIRKYSDGETEHAYIAEPFGYCKDFCLIKNATGRVLAACEALVKADELVRELYPGYFISDYRGYK